MWSLNNTLSNQLTIDEVLRRLSTSHNVSGLALFGSRSSKSSDAVSDYDVLVLISDPPVPIFQMLSHIDRRMADIVFVEISTAEHVLSQSEPLPATSFEGYFVQKMLSADIVYDSSNLLKQVQLHAQTRQASDQLLLPTADSDRYAIWFWLNHGLHHMKRMSQSQDLVYQTATHIMLMGALGNICRDYHRLRNLPWEGEKASVRYLQSHDAEFFNLLTSTLSEHTLHDKLSTYEQLVAYTLKPITTVWESGCTTVYLRGVPHTNDQLELALKFWQELLETP